MNTTHTHTNPYEASLSSTPASLSDRELLERTLALRARERGATAELVAHLAEVDARRLYLGQGFPSLFAYCTGALHLSEGETANRIEAARAARKFPAILVELGKGSVHLTAIRLLAPVLTEENHGELLAAARHKSRLEVERLAAHVRPASPVRTMIRRLAAPAGLAAPEPAAAEAAAQEATAQAAPGQEAPGQEVGLPSGPPSRERIEERGATEGLPTLLPAGRASRSARPIRPLAPDQYRVQFTASEAMHERLRRAQALLRHRVPSGDVAQILDLALVMLLEHVEGRKSGRRKGGRRAQHTESSGSGPGQLSAQEPRRLSRHIPAEVRRVVWKRDEARCAFRTADGRRCLETGFLEFHHVRPFARGGSAAAANIELRCRAHNGYEAELSFGRERVAMAREATRARASGAPHRDSVHNMFRNMLASP
jgi:hypothetical protein